MSRRIKAVTVCLGALIVLLLFLWAIPKPEPAHLGRPLSAWIGDLEWVSSNLDSELKQKRHAAAVDAIRHFGAPITPILLEKLRPENSRWEPLREMFSRLFHLNFIPAREANAHIFAAFEALGPAASSATNSMARLLFTGQIPSIAIALRETFGSQAIPFLVQGLTNQAPRVRAASAAGLRGLGTNATVAGDALLVGLTDSDRDVRLQCVVAIGRVQPASTTAIPLLIQSLKDADYSVREEAAQALGNYGPRAIEALPELKNATHDNQGSVSNRATAALNRILDSSQPANHANSTK